VIVHTDSIRQGQVIRICPTDKALHWRKTRRSLVFDSRRFATELTNGLKISVLDLTVPQVEASSKLVQGRVRILHAVASCTTYDVRYDTLDSTMGAIEMVRSEDPGKASLQ
jgi:hypothetical protein